MVKGKIVLADDDVSLTKSLNQILLAEGFIVEICTNASKLNETIDAFNPDVIFLDIYYGDYNGIDILKVLKRDNADISVIMITAHSDVPTTVEAMREGAEDFVVKPFDVSHLLAVIDRAINRLKLQKKVALLQEELDEQRSISRIIGQSSALRNIPETAERLATSDKRFTLKIPKSGVTVNEVMCDLIIKTLNITNGNQVQAAKVLGLTRSKLRYRMEQLGIMPKQRSLNITGSEQC